MSHRLQSEYILSSYPQAPTEGFATDMRGKLSIPTEKQVLKYLQSGFMRVSVSDKRKLYSAIYSPELYMTSEMAKPKNYQ